LFVYLLTRLGEEEAAWRAPPWGYLGWCVGRSALHVLHGLSVGGGQARRGQHRPSPNSCVQASGGYLDRPTDQQTDRQTDRQMARYPRYVSDGNGDGDSILGHPDPFPTTTNHPRNHTPTQQHHAERPPTPQKPQWDHLNFAAVSPPRPQPWPPCRFESCNTKKKN
jgi:hypothetical protein